MKVEQSQAVKLKITDLERLDPITVFLEDFEPGRGKITIECFGKSWSSFWGAMSGDPVAEFFCRCDEHYLAGKLSSVNASIDCDSDEFGEHLKKEIIKLRRSLEFEKSEARELYDHAGSFDLEFPDHDLAASVFGDDWWYSIPQKPNPKYEYLCRIIKAVQAALKESGLSQPKAVNITTVKGDLNINL